MTPIAPPPPAGDRSVPVAARAPGRAAPAACRDRRDPHPEGDTFDRLLRRKTEEPDSPCPQAEGPAGTGPAAALLALAGGLSGGTLPPPAKAADPPPSSAPADAGPPAAPAAFEAAAEAPAPLAAAPAAAVEATAWQVTLRDPQGLPVELRVSRPEGSASEAAPWSLTVGAGAQHATQLAQHAQRLGERLRTRAVALSHLRIESDGEPPPHSE